MNEEEARDAADAVSRGEHPNQLKGDLRLMRDMKKHVGTYPDEQHDEGDGGAVGRLRQFLLNLFARRDDDVTGY